MFNGNHQRHLMTRLRVLDESLTEALRKLEPQEEGQLARRLIPDVTAAQRRVLRDYLSQLRFAMRRFVQAQHISDTSEPISALKSFDVALTFAQISVEEMRPRYLSGYGSVDAAGAEAAERLAAELQTLLRRMSGYLARGEGVGLSGRLAQLEGTREEAALLRELERIITEQGLVELRTPLQTLIERMTVPRFEIAVFGRVSSGKSSLLNWCLEQPLLPTGVTPVTAVPTRIVFGQRALALVSTPTMQARELPLDEVARYITEDGNPGNREGVLDLLIQVPAARLEEGLMLVDTPGLGSLATAGASQTLEYLPRCDLGILLVEAGGVITREDLDVARAIVDAGSELVVALSKVDRLSTTELGQAHAYATEQFRTALDMPVDIGEISTFGEHAALAGRWFDQVLAPRMARTQEHSSASLKRKIGALRESVMAVLEARLRSQGRPSEPGAAGEAVSISEALPAARARIRHTREELMDLGDRVPRCTDDLVASAAETLEKCWREGEREPENVARLLAVTLAQLAIQIGDILSEPLGKLRAHLQHVIEQMPVSDSTEPLPAPRGRPIFDAEFVVRRAPLTPPRGIHAAGPLLKGAARRSADRALRPLIQEQLRLYANALRTWCLRSLEELSARFDALVAAQESALRLMSNDPSAQAADPERDLQRLRDWPVSVGSAREASVPG